MSLGNRIGKIEQRPGATGSPVRRIVVELPQSASERPGVVSEEPGRIPIITIVVPAAERRN